jgi:hypothetical protein
MVDGHLAQALIASSAWADPGVFPGIPNNFGVLSSIYGYIFIYINV